MDTGVCDLQVAVLRLILPDLNTHNVDTNYDMIKYGKGKRIASRAWKS